MEENQKQQEKKFECTGDCHNCRGNVIENRTQWMYCAAQHAYNAMQMVKRMEESVSKMVGAVEELKGKIEAIQAGEALLLEPDQSNQSNGLDENRPMEEISEPPILPTAQEGSGATQ